MRRFAVTPAATASNRELQVTPRSKAFVEKSARSNAPSAALSSTNIMSTIGRSGWTCGSCSPPPAPSCSTAMHIKRVDFLDLNFDRLTFDDVKDRLAAV